MRVTNARIFVLIALVLGVMMFACPVMSQSSTKAIWPSYHFDPVHTGQNNRSTDILDPGTMNLIWVFPRIDSGASATGGVVDDQAPTGFSTAGNWKPGVNGTPVGTSGAVSGRFHYFLANGIKQTYKQSAAWEFPAGTLPPGKYLVYISVPALDPLTSPKGFGEIKYTVYDDKGKTDVVFDQTKGGTYQPLSSAFFSFTGANTTLGPQRVELASQDLETELVNPGDDPKDPASPRTTMVVMADAIKFVPASGQEIYASPASADIPITLKDPDEPGVLPDVWTTSDPPATCVYVGTVEPQPEIITGPDSSLNRDKGALYCCYGITPTIVNPATLPKGSTDRVKFEKIAKYLGKTKWRYPLNGADVSLRDPLEGPIEGGFYSSPTLADVPGKGLVCFAAASDRQLYALDAVTGRPIWQGPGITVSEPTVGDTGTWWVTNLRDDAFGGTFSYSQCAKATDIATSTAAISWPITIPAVPADGLYDLYVWLPAQGGTPAGGSGTANLIRSHTATYQITYGTGSPAPTAIVKLDQSDPKYMGTWVLLGSYNNPTKVTLANTADDYADPHKPGDPVPPTIAATDFAVVADAIRAVPHGIEGLGYSSPVTDIKPNTGGIGTNQASFVCACSVSGKVMGFDSATGQLYWITSDVYTYDAAKGWVLRQPTAMGEIGASPAFWTNTVSNDPGAGDQVYVASLDGTIARVAYAKDKTGTKAKLQQIFPAAGDPDQNPGGFTSSPTLDRNGRLYIGSTDGTFYCLNVAADDGAAGKAFWQYPAIATNPLPGGSPTTTPPLGAFRYSTPVVSTVHGVKRVWCGSTDGHIYSFLDATGERIWVETQVNPDTGAQTIVQHPNDQFYYSEPSLLSPIQGSVAMAGGGNPVMYVGDMKGVLHWRDAENGSTNAWQYKGWTTPDMLFSSPNVTDTIVSSTPVSWIYLGCADGHLLAFTRAGGGWGGNWQGGDWPFPGSEPDSNANKTEAAPNTKIQFDMFSQAFYDESMRFNPEPLDATGQPDAAILDKWPTNNIVGSNMKIIKNYKAGNDPDDLLIPAAKTRRQTGFLATGRDQNNELFVEWGENLNLILWNLPESKFLYGTGMQAKQNNITITLTNASAGSSAGSQVVFTNAVSVIKDYTVVEQKPGKGGNTYNPLTVGGQPVRRSYALAQIKLDGNGSFPNPGTTTMNTNSVALSPGPGWVINVDVRTLTSTAAAAPVIPVSMPLPKLYGSSGSFEPVLVSSTKGGSLDTYQEANVGVNNPIALWDDNGNVLGWDLTQKQKTSRGRDDSHVNGNARWSGNAKTSGGYDLIPITPLPSLDLGPTIGPHDNYASPATPNKYGAVPHGTSSREAPLGIMDRSAQGLGQAGHDSIDRFRISAGDLRFRGWPNSVESRPMDANGVVASTGATYGFKFPWDLGLGSVDYPDIYSRYQTYQQISTDKDPSGINCSMLGVEPDPSEKRGSETYDRASLRPDTVLVSVDVPRFQPANTVGYTKRMNAYIDTDSDGVFDDGNYVKGRPTANQEAYRSFVVGVKVPPDPKIEVDEQLVDIGRAPHGLGEDSNGSSLGFSAYNPDPRVQSWFKKITIKNAGNVNLYNVRINSVLNLFGDQASPGAILPGLAITSSLDPMPITAFGGFGTAPFTSEGDSATGLTTNLGYTLSKPRVGDPDPTVMTIPDKRKWDLDQATRAFASDKIAKAGWATSADKALPMPVEVSVKVPLTQPIGTYQSWDGVHGVPYVAVFSDLVNSGQVEDTSPVAMPSFQLKVTVRENQLTGGATPITLPQIDFEPNSAQARPEMLARVGDATPAAFRDPADSRVHLFWSTNRYPDMPTPATDHMTPEQEAAFLAQFANAPWFLNYAVLGYGSNNWQSADPYHWWITPGTRIPQSQWAVPPGKSLADANIMPWDGASGVDPLYSVRHYSPCIGENLAVARTADTNRTWLAWAGTADTRDPITKKIEQQNLIFYTDVTHGLGSSTKGGSGGGKGGGGGGGGGKPIGTTRDIFAIEHDATMIKRNPCPVPDGDTNMWMFWQGGSSGNWSIYYSWANDGAKGFDGKDPATAWRPDIKLRTPDCMSSVGSPNPLLRHLWVDLKGTTETDFLDPYRTLLAGSKKLFDVVYAGTNKITRNADVMMSRYVAMPPAGDPNLAPADWVKTLPSRVQQPMARVFDEKLVRDTKFGFYTAKNLAWVRVARGKPSGIDYWGQYTSDDPTMFVGNDPTRPSATFISPDFPYIHVVFPEGYDDGTIHLDPNTHISATDGRVVVVDPVTGLEGARIEEPMVITPQIDDATGLYTYNYDRPAGYSKRNYAKAILGQMLVDYSSGLVRFANALKETQESGKFKVPEVHADYTSQAVRLTTDSAADGSPRAFIEHTSMMAKNGAAVPGLGSWPNGQPAPVDRMWVFWRKTGTAVDSSTIFYSTMRIGVDLNKLRLPTGQLRRPLAIPMDPVTGRIANNAHLTITGNMGPWEVDRTGTKIYFSEVDEGYRSMITQDNRMVLGPLPARMTLKYDDSAGNTVGPLPLDDVSWLTELPEQSLFGFSSDMNVNEGSIYAFADPQPEDSGTSVSSMSSKIWVFWTSTRGGNSDLFWETLCPNFWAR